MRKVVAPGGGAVGVAIGIAHVGRAAEPNAAPDYPKGVKF